MRARVWGAMGFSDILGDISILQIRHAGLQKSLPGLGPGAHRLRPGRKETLQSGAGGDFGHGPLQL
jgi:hypothetical protein